MVRLNLMPWRERRRAQRVRRFQLVLVASLVLALLGVLLLDQLARARLARQVATNALYQAQLKTLDHEQDAIDALGREREAMLVHVAALARLRAGQASLGEVFRGLEEAMPEGVRLTELGLEDGRLKLTGLAASASVIAQLMRDLQAGGALGGLELVYLRQQAAGDAFLVTAQLLAGWS